MIKAVVLDYGNVISEPQDISCYARMAALSGLTRDFFVEAFWKRRPDYDRGTIRGRGMYRAVLADASVSGTEKELDALADRLLEEDLGSWFHVSREVTEWALGLQSDGFTLGILSNMPHEFLERYGERIELFCKADVAVFSCQVSQIKPEDDIYRTLIERLGCKPDEIAFFDDIEKNVEGARKAGIRAFLWTGLEQAKKDWASLATVSCSV